MIRLGKTEVSGGFLLMAALMYYLDGQGLFPWALFCCVIHEAGHCASILLLGGEISRIRLRAAGAEMVLSARRPLSYERELAATLAGPGVNLTAALLAARLLPGESGLLFAGLSFTLGVFNLLPIFPLDGGRALRLLIAALWSERAADGLVGALTLCFAAVLLAGGAVFLWRGRVNPTLLFTALWLTAGALGVKGGEGARPKSRQSRPAGNFFWRTPAPKARATRKK